MQKWNFQDLHQMSEVGVPSTTFDAELRNASFALISFMGFPAILGTYSHFKSAFTIEQIVN